MIFIERNALENVCKMSALLFRIKKLLFITQPSTMCVLITSLQQQQSKHQILPTLTMGIVFLLFPSSLPTPFWLIIHQTPANTIRQRWFLTSNEPDSVNTVIKETAIPSAHSGSGLGPCFNTKNRKTSSTSRTKSQSLNVSCILVQLFSLNPLKPGVKLRMKM